MSGNTIELKVLGISAGHTNSTYTLILEEVKGKRKLPIIIGSFEAQSIAIKMESIKPVRPMTHDLISSITDAFQINILRIEIYDFKEGVFYANIILEKDGVQQIVDSRTSDAIALAIRCDAKIFTNEKMINEVGITTSDNDDLDNLDTDEPDDEDYEDDDIDEIDLDELDDKLEEMVSNKSNSLANKSISELEEILERALEEENYILAAKVRDEINARK